MDIRKTLQAANEYLTLLKKLQTQLNYAEQQVNKTTQESQDKIVVVFEKLITSLKMSLLDRRKELIKETRTIRQNALLPLQESQIVILEKIKNTESLIAEGTNLLVKEVVESDIVEFDYKSSLLGSLPEVPALKDVPYVSFEHDSTDETRIFDICKNIGSLLHIAPVQISTLLERPGAILIDWYVNEGEERYVEHYNLERALGEENINKSNNNFLTCYMGSNTRCLVRDLILNQNYTFRVRCKFEGDNKWSPWSLLQVGKTNIKSFCWEANENFILSNDNKIATPLNVGLMLYSKEIEFNFLECDHNVNNNFLGLFISNKNKEFILKEATICFETNGNIYGCGIKKAMQFTPVVKGSKICFTRNYKGKDNFRIDMDCGNSRVTYDWFVGGEHIYIGANLNSKKWKILIG